MGVKIIATAVHTVSLSKPGEPGNSLDHVITAAKTCLENACVNHAEVDLLLFVGTTKLDMVSEPSTASLIQQRLQLNLSYDNYFAGSSTFSFDIANTGCGFLIACQTLDAIIQARGPQSALVVASDLHPSGRPDADSPFAPTSAAAFLIADDGSCDGSGGFQAYTFRTAPEYGPGIRCTLSPYSTTTESMTRAVYVFDTDYGDQAQRLLVKTIGEHLDKKPSWPTDGLSPRLICSELPGKTVSDIVCATGLPVGAPVDVGTPFGPLNTTAMIAGFHHLSQTTSSAGPILFAACGAGLTAMVGSYNN
jgi:hypothetical protein